MCAILWFDIFRGILFTLTLTVAPVGMGKIFLLFFLCFCEGLRIPDENDYADDVLKVN